MDRDMEKPDALAALLAALSFEVDLDIMAK
jgi:hypothetical protein